MIPRKTTMMTTRTGARFARKAAKSRPAAEPMRMFGSDAISA